MTRHTVPYFFVCRHSLKRDRGILNDLISVTKYTEDTGESVSPFFVFRFNTHFSFLPAGKEIGETVLFFGCRKKSEDYIYEDELTTYSQDGTLAKLHVAFSRDQVRKYARKMRSIITLSLPSPLLEET